tara:strand:+ start:73 stop:549 length:477 start_codon:yes stop_codon:yes gene_type:complete
MESKSAKKRHHHMIEKLGESLIKMPDEVINQLELKNNLKYAISLAKKIKKRGALKRQIKLIGKLTKQENVEILSRKIQEFKDEENIEKKLFRETEFWREKILSGKDKAIKHFFLQTGSENCEIQSVLKKIESCNEIKQRTKYKKQLFKLIHQHLAKKN